VFRQSAESRRLYFSAVNLKGSIGEIRK
jgi:hypothetical protein